jgi:hypothetical protein
MTSEAHVNSDVQEAHPLPSDRAFVLQLRADADPGQGLIFGRVEHVVSARATHFHTLDELLAFIARELSVRARWRSVAPGAPARDGGCRGADG